MAPMVFAPLRFGDSAISEHLEFAWSVSRPGGSSTPVHIPADGRVEVVWSERGMIAGGHVTKPIVTDPRWSTDVYGVQFKVGRAGALLGTASADLVGAPRLLSDLWGRDADLLAEQIHEADGPQARIRTLIEGMERRAQTVAADPVVDHVATRAADPRSRLSSVAGDLGYSERQLRRRFNEAVGFGPKMLQRIERFQRFVSLTRRPGPDLDVARVAADLGYSDESHLARDSRELAGTAPGALAAQRT